MVEKNLKQKTLFAISVEDLDRQYDAFRLKLLAENKRISFTSVQFQVVTDGTVTKFYFIQHILYPAE